MPARLVVQRESEPSVSMEREFGEAVIHIGRDAENTLALDDPRKVVSRRHASLQWSGDRYQLLDNGSHNFTYLNGEKITRHIPYDLKDGDRIRIGDWLLDYTLVQQPEAQDATVVLVNPFYEDVKILSGLLKKMRRTFEDADPDTRELDLQMAIREMRDSAGCDAMCQLVANALLDGDTAPAPEPDNAASAAATSWTADARQALRIDATLNVLLSCLADLNGEAQRFRQEFMAGLPRAVTTPDPSQPDPETLKAALLDPDGSETEAGQALADLVANIEEWRGQQRGVMELFRANLAGDARSMLEELDPRLGGDSDSEDILRVGSLRIPYRIVPLILKARLSERLEEALDDAISRDKGGFKKDFMAPFRAAERDAPSVNRNAESGTKK